MSVSKQKPDVQRATTEEVELIRQLVEKEGVQFCVDSTGEPFAIVPTDGHAQHYPIDSQRFQDLLFSTYFAETGQIASPQAQRYAQSLIREDCRRGAKKLADFEKVACEENVVVQLLVAEMANRDDEFEISTADLHQLLLQRMTTFGYWSKDLSRFLNVFSRRLRRLDTPLRAHGIVVEFDHRESGSHCRITKTDESTPEGTEDSSTDPSGDPSARPPAIDAPSVAADGTEGSEGSDQRTEGGAK